MKELLYLDLHCVAELGCIQIFGIKCILLTCLIADKKYKESN